MEQILSARFTAAAIQYKEVTALAQTTVKDGLLESIGLKDSEVGVAGKMPSIGAKKGPISVTTGE